MKEKLFSITAEDCEWQYFRASGNGGQKKNKTNSACRCVHKASGAVGECSEHREQHRNRQVAFKRMAQSITMRRWIQQRIEEIKTGKTVGQWADEQTTPDKLKIEVQKNGKWVQE